MKCSMFLGVHLWGCTGLGCPDYRRYPIYNSNKISTYQDPVEAGIVNE